MSGPVDTLHAAVFRMLDPAPVPTYRWLPSSADDVPCLVVGRPQGPSPDPDTLAVAVLSVGVYALGRRDPGPDEQAELLFARFWRPPAVEGMALRLDGIEAGTVEVTGLVYPAHTATLSARFAPCP
jgi:hypothetical protein